MEENVTFDMNNIYGLTLCITLALAATYWAEFLSVPSLMLALLFGLGAGALHPELSANKGVKFSAKTMLRLGIVLIGCRITFEDLTVLNIQTLSVIIAMTLITVMAGVIYAKATKIDNSLGILIGGATAICGASAAVALSAVLPQNKQIEHNTIIVASGVTLMGTILMVLYPFVYPWLGLNEQDMGILIGGTIHDVSQVVGAGYSVGQETGDTAIIVKMVRVTMLVPVLLLAFLFFAKRDDGASISLSSFPLFIVGFIAMVSINSLSYIPEELSTYGVTASKFCLVMAITALGMSLSLSKLKECGWKPLMGIIFTTSLLIIVYKGLLAFGAI